MFSLVGTLSVLCGLLVGPLGALAVSSTVSSTAMEANFSEVTEPVTGNFSEIVGAPGPSFVAAHDVHDLMASGATCSGFLQCWLYNLVLKVPDTTINSGGATIEIKDFSCFHIFVSGFDTNLVKGKPNTISFETENVGIECQGYIHAKWHFIHGGADITAIIDDASLTDVVTIAEKDGKAANAHVDSCHMSLKISKLNFKGSVLGALLNVISPILKSFLPKIIEKQVCKLLNGIIDTNITAIIGKINQAMAPNLKPAPSLHPQLPSDIKLVDWAHADILSAITGLISAPTVNCIVNGITQGTGVLDIHPPDLHFTVTIPKLANITLKLNDLYISGLESFSELTVLNLTADPAHGPFDSTEDKMQTPKLLRTSLKMGSLVIDTKLTLKIKSLSPVVKFPELIEDFDVKIDISNIVADIWQLVALNYERGSKLLVGDLTHGDCLKSTLETANVTTLDIELDLNQVKLVPKDPKDLEGDLDHLVDTLLLMLTTSYKPLVRSYIQGITTGPIREFLNNKTTVAINEARKMVDGNSSMCSNPNTTSDKEYVEWNDSVIISAIDFLIDDIFGAKGLDKLTTCLLPKNGIFNGSIFSLNEKSLGLKLDIYDLKLSGYGAFSDLDIIDAVPTDKYKLHNEIELKASSNQTCGGKVCDSPAQTPIGVSVKASVVIQDVQINVSVAASVTALDLLLDMMLKMSENKINHLAVKDMLVPECLASTLVGLRLEPFNLSVSDPSFVLNITGKGINAFNVSKSGKDFNQNTSKALEAVSTALTDVINKNADDLLKQAGAACLAAQNSPKDEGWKWQFALLAVGCLFILGLFVYYNKNPTKLPSWLHCSCCCKKRPENADANVPELSIEHQQQLALFCVPKRRKMTAEQKSREAIDWSSALCFNPRLPMWIRILIPLILWSNVGILVWANWIVAGATVSGALGINGASIDLGNFSEFTLKNSIQDMWNAGVYPLAFLIAGFSGAWPYAKLLCMISAWFLPVQILDTKQREKYLMWLDCLGKWSLVDSYVLVMFLVSFRFHIAELEGALVVDIFVSPESGFYGFLLATMMSLGMSHILLGFHRYAADDYIASPEGGSKSTMSRHIFSSTTSVDSAPKVRYQCTSFGNISVTFMLGLSLVLTVFGCFLDSFEFIFLGLAGAALGDGSTTKWSVISLAKYIPEAAKVPNTFGLHWIQASFLVFVLAMPVCYLLICVALWLVPLTIKRQRQLFTLSEVCYAWSSLEVFILSLIVALTEIGQFAEFTVGAGCAGLNTVLEDFGDPAGCFSLETKLLAGVSMLGTSALVFMIVGQLVSSVAHEEIHRRLTSFNEKLRTAVAVLAQTTPKNSGVYTILPPTAVSDLQDHLADVSDATDELEDDTKEKLTCGNRFSNASLRCLARIGFLRVLGDDEGHDDNDDDNLTAPLLADSDLDGRQSQQSFDWINKRAPELGRLLSSGDLAYKGPAVGDDMNVQQDTSRSGYASGYTSDANRDERYD